MIRKAEEKDLTQLTSIYNYEILHGTATFDYTPKTVEERADWLNSHNIKNHPLIVYEEDGNILGYASLSAFNPKEAYAQAVELSIYIDKNSRGKGIGKQLMHEIILMAKADPVTKKVISVITSGNEVSCNLHKTFGFEYRATLSGVAVKFGKQLGIDYYTLDV